MFVVIFMLFPDAKHLKKAVSAEVIKLTLQVISVVSNSWW